MANRVGKYKLSKKESTLSLADGGTVAGNINVTGNIIGTTAFSASSDPGVAGQLFVTGSQQSGVGPAFTVAKGLDFTGSAYIVMASSG